jgi:RNA-binding protein 39
MKGMEVLDTDPPMKIFVGGLTEHLAEIGEQDLRSIFSFGDIDFIDLSRDPMTGKNRGYAYIQFRKSSSARHAISAMNGFEYKGKVLRVGEATGGIGNGSERFLPVGEFEDSSYLHNLQSRQTLMQKLSKDTGSTFPIMSNPSATPSSGKQLFINVDSIYYCLQLSNLYDPGNVDLQNEPTFYEDIEEDVKEECIGFGQIEKFWLEKSQARVWVKYANRNFNAAKKAFDKLNKR